MEKNVRCRYAVTRTVVESVAVSQLHMGHPYSHQQAHYNHLHSVFHNTLTCPALKKIFVFPKQYFVSS